MAGKLITPEGISGLPYLIAPSSPFIEIPLDDHLVADANHGVHTDFPSRRPFFSTPAGAAMRDIQMELIERRLHNQNRLSYHSLYKGIIVPHFAYDPDNQPFTTESTDCDVFSRLVPAAAGHITRTVIDLNHITDDNRTPVVRDMTDDEFAFFTQPHPDGERPYKHVWYKPSRVRPFLKSYVKDKDFGSRYEMLLVTLFRTDDHEERTSAGREIMGRLVEITPRRVAKKTPLAQRAALLDPPTPEPEAVTPEAA